MKKIIVGLLIMLSASVYAQESIPLISFSSGDTSASVLETYIYKITPQTGDTTSEVNYFYRNQRKSLIVDTEDSLMSTWGTRLLEGAGFGFVINVDYIKGSVPLTDSTCNVFYNEGRIEKVYSLPISIGDFNALINAL